MKIWIICTGEKEGLRPKRCSAKDFDALALRAAREDPGPREEKKLPWEGKQVLTAPCPAAEKTAALLIDGGEVRTEPLLAPVTERAARESGTAPLWLWREAARIQRSAGNSRQPESRKEIAARAEQLMARLEGEEKDCVLIADCILTEELLDRARVRGYTRARTGIFRYQPWERVLLTKRNVHCGGCAHNCLLSNPGCGIGRDKAARKSD